MAAKHAAIDVYRHFIFPVLRLISTGDHERAHTAALFAMSQIQKFQALLNLVSWWCESELYHKPVSFCGVEFKNAVGFAAGLDKNLAALLFFQALGFGFGVGGTVLPYPQVGNPRPRLFRLMREQMLINHMGFNSKGSDTARRNLLRAERRLKIPIGVSLGIMKENATKPEEARLNTVSVLEDMPSFVAFYVVNVSSPNTPGLRDLQRKQPVEQLVQAVVNAAAWKARREKRPVPPVLVKLAPDLVPREIDDAVEGSLAGGASGLVIGNTTIKRIDGVAGKYASEKGGRSGKPLFEIMMPVAQYVHKHAPQVPLILAGGIDSAERAKEALKIAQAVKIHTPLVFGGPRKVVELKAAAL